MLGRDSGRFGGNIQDISGPMLGYCRMCSKHHVHYTHIALNDNRHAFLCVAVTPIKQLAMFAVYQGDFRPLQVHILQVPQMYIISILQVSYKYLASSLKYLTSNLEGLNLSSVSEQTMLKLRRCDVLTQTSGNRPQNQNIWVKIM